MSIVLALDALLAGNIEDKIPTNAEIIIAIDAVS